MHYHETDMELETNSSANAPALFTNTEYQSVLRTSFPGAVNHIFHLQALLCNNNLNGNSYFKKVNDCFNYLLTLKKKHKPPQKNKNKQTKTKYKKVEKSILKSFTLILFHVTFQE